VRGNGVIDMGIDVLIVSFFRQPTSLRDVAHNSVVIIDIGDRSLIDF